MSEFPKSGRPRSQGLFTVSISFTRNTGSSVIPSSFSRWMTTLRLAACSTIRRSVSAHRPRSGDRPRSGGWLSRGWLSGEAMCVRMLGDAEGGGGIDPALIVGDGSLALGGVGGVEAVLSIERDVDDCGFCGVERGAEIFQILRLERAKVGAPRFDLVEVEPGLYVRG